MFILAVAVIARLTVGYIWGVPSSLASVFLVNFICRRHCAYVDGVDIGLTPKEFRIVALLCRHAGQVVTYQTIMRELWGPQATSDNKILRVHMAAICRKIEPDLSNPRYVFTATGVGYRMADGE